MSATVQKSPTEVYVIWWE